MNRGSLLRKTLIATALVLGSTVFHAQAQGLYRIVGADGRVTYSDQAPAALPQAGRVDVMRGASGIVQQGPVGQAVGYRREAAAPAAAPRYASSGSSGPSAPSAPATKPSDPSVEAAVIDVLGMEDIVRRTETICVSTAPAAARRYSAAVDDWARRNARSVLAARRVLTREFDVERRDRVEAGVRAVSAARFGAIGDAPEARVVAWCDRSVAEMAAGQMDVQGRMRLHGPLGDMSGL
jgi:hypothetical protein